MQFLIAQKSWGQHKVCVGFSCTFHLPVDLLIAEDEGKSHNLSILVTT